MGSRCHYSMPGINNPEPLEFFRILRVCYSMSHGALAAKLSLDTASSSNRSPDQSTNAAAAATSSRDAHASTSAADHPVGCSPARRQSLACDGSAIRDPEIMSQLSGHSRLSPLSSVNTTPMVCYETFTPELVRDLNEEDTTTGGSGNVAPSCERLERMRETFSKVIAFLRNTGVIILTFNIKTRQFFFSR